MAKQFEWKSIDEKPKKVGKYLIYRTTNVMKVATYSTENGFGESWDRILAWSEIPEIPKEFTNAQQVIASLKREKEDIEKQYLDKEKQYRMAMMALKSYMQKYPSHIMQEEMNACGIYLKEE